MAESKAARGVLQALVAGEALPPLPPGVKAEDVAAEARTQGVESLLLGAAVAHPSSWASPLKPALSDARRTGLVRTLGQIALARRALDRLEAEGIRALPLKGAVLAETVYDVESDRPMSDVDILALDRWPEAVRALESDGFVEFARGDHAFAFTDPASGGLVELHRSVSSCPGLFPMDRDAVWERSRPGSKQLRRVPSTVDLLVQLALHAAFQHGFVLSLVQWLDFKRVLESEIVDPEELDATARASRAETPLIAALVVAERVVGATIPTAIREALAPRIPRGLGRWLDTRLGRPTAFLSPEAAELGRVRWELLVGRRPELLWRTIVVPGGPEGEGSWLERTRGAVSRALRLAQEQVFRPKALPAEESTADAPEVPFREELLQECLSSFPFVRLSVSGQCMQPALEDGEKVHLVRPSLRRPRLGDVVLARGHDGLRLHRLVWAPPLPGVGWRMKSDRGRLLDPPITQAAILGVVVQAEARPGDRVRRPARALRSLAGGVVARLRMGLRPEGAEATP